MITKEIERVENNLQFLRKDFEKIFWDSTVNDYVSGLQKTSNILYELFNEEYFSTLKPEILNLQQEITNYYDLANNPEYQIAIVGAIKAGKSSLINSLLEFNLLSVDVTPETATLTKIRSSEENYVKVKFYNNVEWDEIWSDANSNRVQPNVFIREYNKNNAELKKNECLNRDDLYYSTENIEDLQLEIRKWTSSKTSEHYFVKEIEIGLKQLKLDKQICLVDTPGLNDAVAYRSNITLDYIDNANAVIVCVNAKTLRNEEMTTVARVFSKAKYKKDKVFILGTQIDTLNSIEDWNKQKLDWTQHLLADEYFNSPQLLESNFWGISSHLNNIVTQNIIDSKIIARLELSEIISEEEADELRSLKGARLDDFSLSNSLIDKINDISKLKEVEDIIFKRLVKNHNESLLKDFTEKYRVLKGRVETFKVRHITSIKELLKATELDKEELEEVISAKKREINLMKEKINQISTNVDKVTTSFNFDFKELENKFNEIKNKIKEMSVNV